MENHENKSKIFFFNEKWKMLKEESKICKVTNWRKRFKIIRRWLSYIHINCEKRTTDHFYSSVLLEIRVYFTATLLKDNVLQLYKPQISFIHIYLCLPDGSDGKDSSFNARDLDLISGLGRSPREGNDNPLQYSCLENSMDRGTWQAIVHGVAKSQIWLSDFH